MSEFENILKRTNEARSESLNLEEYTDGLVKMLGIKINSIFETHQQDILALDKELRNRLFKAVKENFDASLIEVENYPKEIDI